MTRLATSWLVYRLTGSAFLLGIVSFTGQIPTFLFAPFAGVWVDRLDRRQVLLVTQILAMLQSLVLALLTITRHINIQEIIWLSALQGLINAFDMPARQAFLVQMVEEKQDLGNAIAINSSMVNLARLVGPSLAGAVIAVSGEGACFLIDGISYIAVIASLIAMRLPPVVVKASRDSMLVQLKEGWAYVSGFVPVRTILLLFAIVSLMGWPFTVLMPIFAAQILKGGPHTLAFLMGDLGIALMVFAVRGPLLFFMVPPRVLGPVARDRDVRAVASFLLRPRVAFVLWAANIAIWHIPRLYTDALLHPYLHDLEHACWMFTGLLVWTLLIDPGNHKRLTTGGRIALAAAMFAAGQVLTDVLVFSFQPLYPFYRGANGLSARTDQQLAGVVMMVEQLLVLGTFAFLVLRPRLRHARLATA